jgi:hypothetical protein
MAVALMTVVLVAGSHSTTPEDTQCCHADSQSLARGQSHFSPLPIARRPKADRPQAVPSQSMRGPLVVLSEGGQGLSSATWDDDGTATDGYACAPLAVWLAGCYLSIYGAR